MILAYLAFARPLSVNFLQSEYCYSKYFMAFQSHGSYFQFWLLENNFMASLSFLFMVLKANKHFLK